MTCPACGQFLDGIFMCQHCELDADQELRLKAWREIPKGFRGEGWIEITTPRSSDSHFALDYAAATAEQRYKGMWHADLP